jgi:hypothetical protein
MTHHLARLREWIEDHPHVPWFVTAAVFFIVGGVLWCCDLELFGFLSAVMSAILTGCGVDEYEGV